MNHIQVALNKTKRDQEIPVEPVRADAPRPVPADVSRQVPAGFARAVRNVLPWSSLQPAHLQMPHLAQNRIISADRSDPAYTSFDRLRTKILREMKERNWTSLAITSPTASCGKSVVALNLAFSLGHQEECRSLLIDLDLAQTRMADILGIDRALPTDEFLMGRQSLQSSVFQHGNNLAFLPNGRPASFTSELLQSTSAKRVLGDACRELQPDIVIYDLPPMLGGDDVLAFLPQVDCVMLVAGAEISTAAEIDICERELAERSNVLGVVLNQCHYPQDKYGY